MIGESRPLRFVMVIVGGWIGVRVALLWPAYDPAAVLMAASSAAPVSRPARAEPPSPAFGGSIDGGSRRGPVRARATMPRLSPPHPIADASEQAVPLIVPARFVAAVETGRATPTTAQFPIGAPLPVERGPVATRARLAGSAWLIARGAGPAAPFTPQLGGSQAGARLTYALGDSRRVAIAARLSSALAMRQREAAIGLDWQPTALPVHLFAEQRVALAGGRGGPAIGVIAGLPSTRIAAGFSLDGYGQAGAIGRNGGEGFVDAAAHVTRPVAAIGKARIELGLGAWGGAQRGAARLDIGPSASVAVPAIVPLRITLDWRQRIAGDATPSSGPALSIGADF
ncbi:hypothetical protein [uncultured Sphingomonas sp.]|uniref:hypothetical protein n=1 Tax=uncultured Sphingomonas sp. TaxID=158754 RepID=UPI0026219066|nr:hypothetical protein [uncultured Sphingomonas sp.]